MFSCISLSLFLTVASAKGIQLYDYIGKYSEGLAVAGAWSGRVTLRVCVRFLSLICLNN
ncbi:hypothetical protein [Ruminiclostridium cellulolyticum]|uniref:hypothetical protein n=1 Tax=Ruminiclostridium cellulolyticum TaxID=1521 RepID=UPI0012FB3E1B|nr:hypothetical protein [Ruminiclostridium cellulolyticum]